MSESARGGPSASAVAAYLRRHPSFLDQFPDLALSLRVPREAGEATSLASYQLEVLREKNRELSRRLHELCRNAEDNERLAVRVHQQALLLMRQHSALDTLRAMAANLAEEFSGELLCILLFRAPEGYRQDADWLRVLSAEDPRLAPLADFLAAGEPLCGRLQQDRLDLLFAERAQEVQSAALLPLGERGLLAIGARDGNRFFPGVGTLFLRMMGDSLDAALGRFDAERAEDR